MLFRSISGNEELFDLEEDPDEMRNLSAVPQREVVRERLRDLLYSWMESVDDPLLRGPIESPSYTKAFEDYRCRRSSRA